MAIHYKTSDISSFSWPIGCIFFENYSIPEHSHEFLELNMIIEGSGIHSMEGKARRISKGDIFVIPPNYLHEYSECEKLDVYHFLISPVFLTKYHHELYTLPGFIEMFAIEPQFRVVSSYDHRLHLSGDELVEFETLMQKILYEVDQGWTWRTALIAIGLYAITCFCRQFINAFHIDNTNATVRHPQYNAITQALRFIGESYSDDIQLQDIADKINLDKSYFCRLFHSIVGTTPMKYLINYRLNIAKEMLIQPNISITEIAHAVGFYDVAHFSKAFSKSNGINPSEYRKRLSGTLIHQ